MKRDPLFLYVALCLVLFTALAAVALAAHAANQYDADRAAAAKNTATVAELNRQMAGVRAIIACLSTVTVGEGQAVVVMNPSCLR